MELLQFRYFLEAARYENLTRAADELHIAQPALSQSIMRLENELGVTLFEKVGRGVTLTKAGKMFLEYANRILEDCNVAVDKMQELSSDGGKLILDIFFRWRGITFRIKSEDFWSGRKIKM